MSKFEPVVSAFTSTVAFGVKRNQTVFPAAAQAGCGSPASVVASAVAIPAGVNGSGSETPVAFSEAVVRRRGRDP